ncbi:hypothetical protein BBK82_37470 [Lentzea guizhouensis]|uniref:Uncharacterized protein n=1 Tax=Lentzea guizhouensis TaxID=1586287 RepID=A0A1B2HT10_9PSEU|nr:hypothetical protein BBK82_37470 [Lentzea guizhouensis]
MSTSSEVWIGPLGEHHEHHVVDGVEHLQADEDAEHGAPSGLEHLAECQHRCFRGRWHAEQRTVLTDIVSIAQHREVLP